MDNLGLGKIITGEAHRDAIHVAIAPVVADVLLLPGNRVGLVPGTTDRVTTATTSPIGIVDPFLVDVVRPGQRCWVCLFPGTVTSLRHEWTHPAFVATPIGGDKAESERWLREYASRMNCYDEADAAFARLIKGLKSGELHARGSDLYGFHDLNDADDLKHHAETYLGIRISWGDFSFSCSC